MDNRSHVVACLQPHKTQLWAPPSRADLAPPGAEANASTDEGPPGFHHFGRRHGEGPTDPYPMGNEAFIQDHLRDVAAVVTNDLRKIAVLPDKLEGETAGLQVSWALISKTLPPRVVHLLRAHPVEHTQELCDTLQDAVMDTVRQLLAHPHS